MLTEFDKKFYVNYLKDLSYIPEKKWMRYVPEPLITFIKPTLEYIEFIFKVLFYISLSLLSDLTFPFSQPYCFFIMIASLVIVVVFLCPLNIVLKIVKFIVNTPKVKSLINIPKFYDEKDWESMLTSGTIDEIVQKGRKALGSPVSNKCGPKIFDLDMAETLLILSTIIYEQDTEQVREIYHKLKHNESNSYDNLAIDCYNAHKHIHEEAGKLKLKFRPLSELDCLDALFAGMFWSEDDNFIVVTFKGTTPTNFTEWLTDFLYIREDAHEFVFGMIHRGFYRNFFPEINNESLKKNKMSYPALRIVEAIRVIAREIYSKNKKDVNIWVTGHSLGAGLAKVFYARLIKSNSLPKYCVLRDAFIFAGPTIGDKDFSFLFNRAMNNQFEEEKTLWQIINTNDIVPCVPPSYSSSSLLSSLHPYVSKNDLLNYYRIGDEIHFYLNGKEPEGIILREKSEKVEWDREIDEELEYEVLEKKINEDKHKSSYAEELYHSYCSKGRKDNIHRFERFVPGCIRNHMPHRYFIAMERLKSENIVPMVGFL